MLICIFFCRDLCFIHLPVVLYCCIYRGLFKTDRVIGTAQLKLETLENHCELREIIEVSSTAVKSWPQLWSSDYLCCVFL